METIKQIKARIKARKSFNKKMLWNIRLMLIKEEKFIWFFLLFALIFPAIPFANMGISIPLLHPFRVILDNVCYGYIAGMIFYLFSDFRPRSYRIYKAKQHLASLYRSIHVDYVCAAETLGMIDDEEHIVGNYETIVSRALFKEKIDDNYIAIKEEIISKVKAMLNLVDKEIEDLLLLHNGDLEEDEIKDINGFLNLFDKLKTSNLYDYVSSNDIVVANNDLVYFLSSLGLNYEISKRLKERYSVYNFNAEKYDNEYKRE